MSERIDLADLRWYAEHAGGDDIADMNSWRAVGPHLLALVEAVEAARDFYGAVPITVRHQTEKRALGEKLARFADAPSSGEPET